MGTEILLCDLISKPENSIIEQAHNPIVYCPYIEQSPLYSPAEAKKRNHSINP